jgi:nucleoside-diphosphate-sugar epimerase
MRILIVGGTGLMSSELSRAASGAGHELTVVNRGRSSIAPPPPLSRVIHVDATDPSALRAALRGQRLRGERFDAVVQFIAYGAEQVRDDLETFGSMTNQYVLIATSAAYRTFDRLRPLTEDVPLENHFWQYARDKIACEEALREGATKRGLPFTIVRPAHTYGPSKIPAYTGNSRHPWTVVDRMRRGADIVIPGDGTSLWTLTHARDVASGILGLLGNERASGRAVHITSSEALTWTGIYAAIARAAGMSAERFATQCVFVPSEALIAAAPSQEGSIRGDKMHPAVYDTTLIRELVPGWEATTSFESGLGECMNWFEADASRQSVDAEANAMFDRVATVYRDALQRVRT